MQFSCALDSTGHPYCWGRNSNGQIGVNSDGAWYARPISVFTP
ncbi:hypothetical protein KKF84_06060 [Myxococcota bacterium]|nr:hypothetical protein [Myxococcota bacterium]MBU1534863.1 hypothetical protein [Myxococcota bacterium]